MSVQQKWVIKDNRGRVQGPFTTPQVMRKISMGDFTGDELISEYPGSDWFPISKDPKFYDKLLEVLAGATEDLEASVVIDTAKIDIDADDDNLEIKNNAITQGSTKEATEDTQETEDNGPLEKTQPLSELEDITVTHKVELIDDDKTNEVTISGDPTKSSPRNDKSKKAKPKPKDRDPLEVEIPNETGSGEGLYKRDKSAGIYSHHDDDDEVIELSDEVKLKKKAKRKASKIPLITFSLIILGAAVWFILPHEQVRQSRVRLLVPTHDAKDLAPKEVDLLIKKSASNYLSDTFQGYKIAQSQLVRALESNNKGASNWALLCLIYYELWPYSFQDGEDKKAIKLAVRNVSRVQPGGIHSTTCNAVDLMISGRESEADSIIKSGLRAAGTQGEPPIALYFLKAHLMQDSRQLNSAIGYARSAQDLWKGWVGAQILEAELQAKAGKFQNAVNIYKTVLAKNPQHTVAAINLGNLQYRKYNRLEEAYKTLKAGLSKNPVAPNEILSKGYYSLAEISLKYKETKEALAYAKKAYYFNPANPGAKNLVQQIGGAKAIQGAKADIRELIAEGDYYYRQEDYVTALAHYRTAYEIDNDSAIAALKAGKSSWSMNFSENAIHWLNLSIKADPKLIDAYVTLADYYAQRYDFSSASKILNKANQISPKNFEVFRGFAMIEFRRNNFEGAIGHAKKALSQFDFDVNTHIILAKSYLEMKKYNEAHNAASVAIETDMNSREAQITYADTLAGIEGVAAGISYLNSLIRSFPVIIEYRIALADVFMEEERYNEALAVYKDVLRFKKKTKKAYMGLGAVYKAIGDAQSALNALLKASIIDPSDVKPLFEIALLYLQTGEYSKAKKQFGKVLKTNSRYPRAHFFIGQAMLQMRDYKGAIEQAQLERRMNPNLSDSYLLSAEAYYRMKKYSQCAREYQQAIRIEKLGAGSYIRMSRCYRMAGNLEIAVQMLNRAASIESGLPEIYKEQGALFETQGEVDAAIRAYEKYLALDPAAKDRGVIERRIMELQ